MSADNWAVCPKRKAKREIVAGLYGTVSEADYLAALDKAKKPMPQDFREDYSIGIDDTREFTVIYRGSCQECSLKYSYTFTANITDKYKAQ